MNALLDWIGRDDVTDPMLRAFAERPDACAAAIRGVAATLPRSMIPLPKRLPPPDAAPTRPAPPFGEPSSPFEDDPDGARPTVAPPPAGVRADRTSAPDIETHLSARPPGEEWDEETSIVSSEDLRRQLGSDPPLEDGNLDLEEIDGDDDRT